MIFFRLPFLALRNRLLFTESLYGWGDNLKYDQGPYFGIENYTSLEKLGYMLVPRPNFHLENKINQLHQKITATTKFDRWIAQYKLSKLDKTIRFYRNL